MWINPCNVDYLSITNACYYKNNKVVKYLVDSAEDLIPFVKSNPYFEYILENIEFDVNKQDYLLEAIKLNNLELVKLLISKSSKFDSKKHMNVNTNEEMTKYLTDRMKREDLKNTLQKDLEIVTIILNINNNPQIKILLDKLFKDYEKIQNILSQMNL